MREKEASWSGMKKKWDRASVVGAVEELAAERELADKDGDSVVCFQAALVEISRAG
jgi:hypothetical protein